MAGKVREYERLAGRMRLGLVRGSLWLGRDHLLKVTSTGYSEEYKRYYFKDIQAILVQRTAGGTLWSLVFGAVILLACLIGFAAVGGEGGVIFVLCVSIPLGILLVMNMVKGPTCLCRIRTAVQTDKIEALHRLNKAQAVLARLRPIILEAQGGFTENDLARMHSLARENAADRPQAEASALDWIVTEEPVRITLPDAALQAGTGASAPVSAPAAAGVDASAAPRPAFSDGPVAAAMPRPTVAAGEAAAPRVARVNAAVLAESSAAPPVNVKTMLCTLTFSLMLLDAVFTLINITHSGMTIVVANIVSGLAAMLMSILAAARLPHVAIVSRVRRVLLIYIFFVLILTFVNSVFLYQTAISTRNPELIDDGLARIRWMVQHPVLESPGRLIRYLAGMAGSLGISLYGFWQLRLIGAMRKAAAGTGAAGPLPAAVPAAGAVAERQES